MADSIFSDLNELSYNEAEHMEEDYDYDGLDSVSKLQKSHRYTDIMRKIEEVSDEDPKIYQLIIDCNALSVDIDDEIVMIHNFIRNKYCIKFPELESLVHHPIDCGRVVKKIGNEMDATLVDLQGVLPYEIVMAISATASTTSGKPLGDDILQKTIDACDRALALDSAKKKIVDFIESRMRYLAPNLSGIVGGVVAAKLMGTAGGLSALAAMLPCNVLLLGAEKKNTTGLSTQFLDGVSYLEETEIFQSTPPSMRMHACRLLAGKSTLAALIDSTRGVPTGKMGRICREEFLKKIEKWREQPKPLPKKKRGGRTLSKRKERYSKFALESRL